QFQTPNLQRLFGVFEQVFRVIIVARDLLEGRERVEAHQVAILLPAMDQLPEYSFFGFLGSCQLVLQRLDLTIDLAVLLESRSPLVLFPISPRGSVTFILEDGALRKPVGGVVKLA